MNKPYELIGEAAVIYKCRFIWKWHGRGKARRKGRKVGKGKGSKGGKAQRGQ